MRMKLIACLMLWFACAVQASAALPMSHEAPVASQRALSQRTLESARAQGTVRVMVVMRDVAPRATRANLAQRRVAVANRVDKVLARTPRNRLKVRTRFDFVPAMAIEADAVTLQRLAADPDVLRIDLDAPGHGSAIAPDTALTLSRVADLAPLGYDGTGMTVAVIDSGIDTDHPDFAGRILGQQCFCSINASTAGCCPNAQPTQSGQGAAEDAHGHGTNVTGIIAGNGTAAPRGALPKANLVAVRVLDASNNFCCSSDIVKAMDWVAANYPGVDAVNMSLGTAATFAGDCDNVSAYTVAMATAIANLRALGANVAVSAGNDAKTGAMEAPACVRDAFSVGATYDSAYGFEAWDQCGAGVETATRKIACFSNRSTTTDLFAAGAWVTASGRGGGSSSFAGTSQAAPQATACAAALKQAAAWSTVDQREEAMRLSTTRILDDATGRIYPFLDCVDAMSLVQPKVLGCKVSPTPVKPTTQTVMASPVARTPVLRLKAR